MDRAGDVTLEIEVPSGVIPPPAQVYDAEIRIVQVGGEPIGLDQRSWESSIIRGVYLSQRRDQAVRWNCTASQAA